MGKLHKRLWNKLAPGRFFVVCKSVFQFCEISTIMKKISRNPATSAKTTG